jgi:hypothetical protein
MLTRTLILAGCAGLSIIMTGAAHSQQSGCSRSAVHSAFDF